MWNPFRVIIYTLIIGIFFIFIKNIKMINFNIVHLDYELAFNKFKESFDDLIEIEKDGELLIYDDASSKIKWAYNQRDLYDFFEQFDFIVSFLYKYKKWHFFILNKQTEGYLLQNLSIYCECYQRTKYFESRVEAEDYAFLRCFELLNEKLFINSCQ